MNWFVPLMIVQLEAAPATRTVPVSSFEQEPIEIVLYSDFQCPYCAQFAQPIRELQAKGTDGIPVHVTFKNFPLRIHPSAPLAHQAALAAAEQGKFWEMHDLLFANPAAVTWEDLLKYAGKLELDPARFAKDMDSDRIKDGIKADLAEGEERGVSGTPTFFIDGKSYSGTRSVDQLKQLVQDVHRRRRALAEIPDDLLTKGPATAPVTLEFFADLQSPVSRPAFDVVQELMRSYPADVRLQFRNFPLAFHPQAGLAHEAAMTAAAEGHFWEFAAFCLEHQDALREQDLIAYAGRLGLDETRFAQAVREHRYAPRVDADLMEGLNRGIRGSPVIFVNSRRIDGVPRLETLIEYVEVELAGSTSDKSPKP